jgi:uncharacterized protein
VKPFGTDHLAEHDVGPVASAYGTEHRIGDARHGSQYYFSYEIHGGICRLRLVRPPCRSGLTAGKIHLKAGRQGAEGLADMRILQKISFDSPPTLLASWPGMGNVGLIAIDYLRRKLDAHPFAEIDMGPFFIPESIVVKDGLAQFPQVPASVFHFSHKPEVIVFESNAQVGGHDGIAIAKAILDVAQQFGARRIYTAAAFCQSMTHRTTSDVLASCTTPELLAEMSRQGITPMPDGYIAGLNGLMLGVANTRSIDAACFLGTIPSYATNLSYPKASLEIVKVFAKVLGAKVDLVELEASVAEMDRQLATIEERIKQIFPSIEEHDEEIRELDEDKVPHHIMERIERLFQVVEKDHARAPELKAELDRWKLFELYEDRFLDIFDNARRRGRQRPSPRRAPGSDSPK